MSNEDRAALARPLASITTATVDVQVLRIGAKQMTLAVFRQLARDDALDGPMWGTVRYCHRLFDYPCDPTTPWSHQHVVWQDGSELRHAIRRSLEGIGSAHSALCFTVARRLSADRRYEEQAIVDHAGTFPSSALQVVVRSFERMYGHDMVREAAGKFMGLPPGDWHQQYRELEEAERPFEILPQLFIAV